MILALDYGTKRVGVAVSDPTGFLASPLPFLPAHPWENFLSALQKIVQERKIEMVLIGIPRNMDGSYGTSAQAAKEFAEKLKTALEIKIQTVDERLSTVQASRMLREAGLDAKKQKDKIDSASARIMLQQYLDRTGC